jgi:hypothetical protein
MKQRRSQLILYLFVFFFLTLLPGQSILVESVEGMQSILVEEGLIPKKQAKRQEKPQRIKGIWVNVWNYPQDLDRFFTRLKSYDINTIYLQVNRSTTPVFKHQDQLDRILELAHQNKIQVIGWSYCYLNEIDADIKKFVEPALYKTATGHSLDGMAADIEENTSLYAVQRYTEGIKAALPESYPLHAIVFSPKIKPKYPWKYIGENWDVLMPMTYWHGIKNRDKRQVFNFVRDTIVELRKYSENPDLKIHLITDGEKTSPEEVRISLDLAKELKVDAGVSVYPEHLVSDKILEEIKNF